MNFISWDLLPEIFWIFIIIKSSARVATKPSMKFHNVSEFLAICSNHATRKGRGTWEESEDKYAIVIVF